MRGVISEGVISEGVISEGLKNEGVISEGCEGVNGAEKHLLSVAKELGSAGCYSSFDLPQENLLYLETIFSSLRFEEKVEHSI